MKVKILGSGQDAGIPHPNCACQVCNMARKNEEYVRLGPSIAIYDEKEKYCFLIDASFDFKKQLDMIGKEIQEVKREGKLPISGILMTHAHLGHCTGLLFLGKEVINEEKLPVFCSLKMKQFLKSDHPFGLLVENGNIEIREIIPHEEIESEGFKCIPFKVPHRNEVADTVGYIIQSKKRMIYIPDVDYWPESILEEIKNADFALIDGTFYSRDEIPRFEEVPHPPISESMELLMGISTEVYFTHINHSNAINVDVEVKKEVEERGFGIAYDGMMLEI